MFATPGKGWAITLLCLLFALSNVLAQETGGTTAAPFEYDVSEAIKKLPKKDGTYLLKKDDTIRIYAIVKGGQMVGLEVKDRSGNLIPFTSEPVSTTTTTSGERRPLKCGCCIPSGCIRYNPPCDRCSYGTPSNY